MTIRQRGREGICESQFWVDGTFYQFTFNGKSGRSRSSAVPAPRRTWPILLLVRVVRGISSSL